MAAEGKDFGVLAVGGDDRRLRIVLRNVPSDDPIVKPAIMGTFVEALYSSGAATIHALHEFPDVEWKWLKNECNARAHLLAEYDQLQTLLIREIAGSRDAAAL